ncbi:hypothetical protein [Psychromonas sp. Urea-02u-13]|uniref:hypothetical protein n=1 Tax=Psychromonas sp. Urea-02u-13 TaxID=2058326 RepID=UPI000C343523|nr:hypothetical protein [Psychromonas sp. Urea-02u-13]PKG38578.1 hypothetical protein CXF74_12735 [Psychromonas sp. Urea-02u-13]
MKFQQSLISLFVLATLSACGGSSSSSSTTAESLSLAGKAADGYLSNAKVCLDLNNNKVCDTDEPSAVTGDGGEFTLIGVTQAQIDGNPLLVEIVAGETIDEDEPGVVLTQGYTLSAPAGYTFVSPLTSLVQNEIDNGSSVAEAEVSVQGKLGTTLSLNEDYVAGTDGQENAAEFEKLHQIAQVTANIIADNMTLLESAAETEDISLEELISLVTNEVYDALNNITQQVEDIATDDSLIFDADGIATEVDEELISLESGGLSAQVAQNEAENTSTATSLATLIKGTGINWFWSEENGDDFISLEFGRLNINSDGTFTDIEYEINADGVTEERVYEAETDLLLTSSGWIVADDTIMNIILNEDNSITLIMETSELNETVTGKELILDGLNVQNALSSTGGDGSWADTVTDELVFPEGSRAYQLTFSNTAYPYELNMGDWCETDDVSRWEALDGTCNAVYLNGSWATTLASLTKASAATSPYTELTSVSAVIGLANTNIVTEIMTGGIVNFYNQDYDNNATKLASGSWKDLTVHGKVLREISVPASIATISGQQWTNVNDDDNKLYLTAVDGFVRVVHADNDFGDDGEYAFNTIAKEFILENADRDNIDSNTTETVTISTLDITVDGVITDWGNTSSIISDANGDAGVGALDLTALYLAQDDSNLYLRLDKASLALPIVEAYYNYWIYFESDDGGPEFAVELFHSTHNEVSPRLYDSTGVDRDYNSLEQLSDSLTVNTSTQYIEVMIPKSFINNDAKYSIDFFTHYSNEVNTWNDDESEHDTADTIGSVIF